MTDVSDTVLEDLLATAKDATLLLSLDGRIVASNENARGLLAPVRGELTGLGLAEISRGPLARICRLVEAAMKSDAPVTECDVVFGVAACKLTVSRGEAHWVVRIRDETEPLSNLYRMRDAEAEKDEIRAMMLTAFNNISVAIVAMDPGGKPIYVNRFARRFVGDLVERAEPENFCHAVGLFDEGGTALLASGLRPLPRALRGETVLNQRLVLRNAITQQSLRMDANAAPFHGREGRIAGAIGWFYVEDKGIGEAGHDPADIVRPMATG